VNIVTADTFQLTHSDKVPFKCSFDIGDRVNSPLGKGRIVTLDKVTGNCTIELFPRVNLLDFS